MTDFERNELIRTGAALGIKVKRVKRSGVTKWTTSRLHDDAPWLPSPMTTVELCDQLARIVRQQSAEAAAKVGQHEKALREDFETRLVRARKRDAKALALAEVATNQMVKATTFIDSVLANLTKDDA